MNFTLKRLSADENHNFSIKARVQKLWNKDSLLTPILYIVYVCVHLFCNFRGDKTKQKIPRDQFKLPGFQKLNTKLNKKLTVAETSHWYSCITFVLEFLTKKIRMTAKCMTLYHLVENGLAMNSVPHSFKFIVLALFIYLLFLWFSYSCPTFSPISLPCPPPPPLPQSIIKNE